MSFLYQSYLLYFYSMVTVFINRAKRTDNEIFAYNDTGVGS